MIAKLTFAGLAVLFLSGCAAEAETVEEAEPVPVLELTGRVVDAANILSPEFEARLTQRLSQLEADTKVQLVVASTPSLDDREIEDYSFDLANGWGLGSKERNDGLLVLLAPIERSVRIEVGIGLEASVKDEEAAMIIRDDMLPHFRSGDYETGIEQGVDSLIEEVTLIELKEAA